MRAGTDARAPPDAPVTLSAIGGTSPGEAMERLGTGLSSGEALSRFERYGSNALPSARPTHPLRELTAQFIHFFAVMLWAAAVLAFVGRMPQLGWAIIAVVLVNGVFAFVQEFRADRATRALSALLPGTARVVRDGRKETIPIERVVPGDVILLTEGARVPADARVTRAQALKLDTSMLTGESEPVERDAGPCDGSTMFDATNVILAGTYVTSGTGEAVVVATGALTQLGRLSRITRDVVRRPTPLRREMTRLVRVVAFLAISAGVAFLAISLALGTPARDGFLFAVGVIVALVPEGLLPTLTLSMAHSAKRMAHRRALVRHLEAVETLGATTVICTDKTGTITENEMTARLVAVAGRRFEISGSGYEPEGTLLVGHRPVAPEERRALLPLLTTAALCGDATVGRPNGAWRCTGDPTEGALLVLGGKGGIQRLEAERSRPRVKEFPFESRRRLMSTVHVLPSGRYEVLVKGSPEAVLDVATTIRQAGTSRRLDEDDRARIASDIEAMAERGLRIIALAHRHVASVPDLASDAEQDLEFLGLVGLEDPVRADVPDAVARCRRAGIRIVMVTGDHPATAETVARKAGLPRTRALIGSELPDDDEALAALLAGAVTVIARVTPEQKLRIARVLQEHGDVVAMTGDGVNDAPALRQADIGIAMGRSGTDVAREAADLILLDDSFAHIVEAVEEGRAAFDNIRRFLTYHLTDNVAELTPFVVWALSGGSIPLALTVLQILALDIGTDLLPALALGAEAPEPGTMTKPPRTPDTRLIDRSIVGRAFGFLGPIEALLSLTMMPLGAWMFLGWHPGRPLPAGGASLAMLSTMVFAAIVAMQMANAFECRSTTRSLLALRPFSNRLLSWAVFAESVALAAFVYIPPLRAALGHAPIAWTRWLPVLATPVLLVIAEELRKQAARTFSARKERAGDAERRSPRSDPRRSAGIR